MAAPKVHLVRCLTVEGAVRHHFVVLGDVKSHEAPKAGHAVEQVQIQPLMPKRSPKSLDHGVGEAHFDLGEHSVKQSGVDEGIELAINVFAAGVSDHGWRRFEVLSGFGEHLTRRRWAEIGLRSIE